MCGFILERASLPEAAVLCSWIKGASFFNLQYTKRSESVRSYWKRLLRLADPFTPSILLLKPQSWMQSSSFPEHQLSRFWCCFSVSWFFIPFLVLYKPWNNFSSFWRALQWRICRALPVWIQILILPLALSASFLFPFFLHPITVALFFLSTSSRLGDL